MDDSVGDQNISNNNVCVVDLDTRLGNLDLDFGSIESWDLAGLKLSRVGNGSSNNVVGQDVSKLLDGKSGSDLGDSLESLVGWSEDGDVLSLGHSADEISLGEGTGELSKVVGSRGISDGCWDGENGVDNVDDSSIEGDIGGGDLGLGAISREDGNSTVLGNSLDNLSTGDVGVGGVGQQGSDKGGSLGEVSGLEDTSGDDVVLRAVSLWNSYAGIF